MLMTVFAIVKLRIWLQKDIDRLGIQAVKCNMVQLTKKEYNKIQALYTLEGTGLENVESIKYSADDEFCTRLKSRVKCTFRSKG